MNKYKVKLSMQFEGFEKQLTIEIDSNGINNASKVAIETLCNGDLDWENPQRATDEEQFIYQVLKVERSNLDAMEHLEHIYLDYTNHFLTVGGFASHYGITEQHAAALIELAKTCKRNEADQ